MTIISSPYPFVFVNGTIADATQVNADFNYVQAQVNSNAAHNGANSDITSMSALVSITVSNMIMTNVLNASGVCSFSQDILMTGTGELDLPSGTTGQRSGSPTTGMIRYNTTTNSFEGYGGAPAGWASFGSGASVPSFIDLNIFNNAGTPTTKLDVTSVFAQMITPSNFGVTRNNVSFTINAATIGINGLDTGSLAANTTYHIWMIDNGTVTAGLLSLSSTSPALPSGYIYKARAGAVITNSSSQFPMGLQYGNKFVYIANVAAPVLYTATTSTTATVSLVGKIPATAAEINMSVIATGSTSANILFSVFPNPATVNHAYTAFLGTPGSPTFSGPVTIGLISTSMQFTSVVSGSGGVSGSLVCVGWTDTISAF